MQRKALTLLELVVVMVILVALAGILVPMLPGMLGRAHSSTHATNVAELNKAWELYNATFRGYPDGLDSLVTASGDLFAKLPQPATGSPYTAESLAELATACGTTPATTAAQILARLNEAGIKTVYNMVDATPNATFQPYGEGVINPTAATIDATTKLARLASAQVNERLSAPSDGVYVVLGIGNKCTVVGRGGIVSAPLHFSDEASDAGDPAQRYHRYGVVFNVARDPAEFVGTIAFHADGISGVEQALEEYFSSQRSQ